MDQVKLSFSSNPRNVNYACISIKNFLSSKNIPNAISNEIELSVAEAVNNIIRHAYKGNTSELIEVEVKKNNNYVEIVFTDSGIPRENLEKPKLNFDPNDIENLPEGGFGLYLIDTIMDENDYYSQSGKNILRLKKIIDTINRNANQIKL
ncbi:serine-protein kinase RsbW [bacterium BMS3Abin04]|nr:serine-protein kinase RsbW [bacterium BMS3Abin04]